MFDEESRYLDRFGLLLILTVTSVVVLSFVDLSGIQSDRTKQAAALVASALTAAALLVALRAAGLARRWQRPADIVIVTGLLLAAVLLIADPSVVDRSASSSSPPAFSLLLAIVAPIVVVRRLLMHRRVGRSTLLGSVAVYLLIAVAFFYAFLSVDLLQAKPFFAQAQPTSDFMYFSLSTITTVGYGDLVAVAQPGKLLANTEAVLGQLYLVTFVGLLIGLLIQQGRDPVNDATDTEVAPQPGTRPSD